MANVKINEAKIMSTAIAIFVKTPSLSPVKTRLAAEIGGNAAKEFYRQSLKAIQETIKAVDIIPYWAIAEENGLNDPLWQSFSCLHTGEGNLGERQHRIYEILLKEHDHVLLIGGDAPQLSKEILEQAINELLTNDFVIGPARDGGYYLFGGRLSTNQKSWISVPWSTSITRESLEETLSSKPIHLPILTDVDTKNNLEHVCNEMPSDMNCEQQNIIKWITALHS
jgi:rSAM/selenodomain-associated transferase 1